MLHARHAVRPRCRGKEGKRSMIAYCLTQCSNGCSLGSLLFPRQNNHVPRPIAAYNTPICSLDSPQARCGCRCGHRAAVPAGGECENWHTPSADARPSWLFARRVGGRSAAEDHWPPYLWNGNKRNGRKFNPSDQKLMKKKFKKWKI